MDFFATATAAKARLKARLEAELPAVLEEADALAGDGITTPPPYAIYTHEKTTLDGFPSIEMVLQASDKTLDSTLDVYRHRVLVAVTIASDDEGAMTLLLERYLWALRQFGKDRADDRPTPSDVVDPIFCGREQYSPIVHGAATGVEFPWVKGGFIEMAITTYG
jgi:hypothetical protein